MTESGDDRLRSAWAKQTDPSFGVDAANAEARVRRRQAAIARRDRSLYACALVIGPSWAAAIWFWPDLWLASGAGLLVAAWLAWQMYRRSGARVASASADLPCLVFQRALLERELDLARSTPKWYLIPVAVAQVAIVTTLVTNPRFSASQFFYEGLTLFVGTAGVALVVWWRRWQRQALELQRELEAIGAASEWNSSVNELR
jgi:hypothetical protein